MTPSDLTQKENCKRGCGILFETHLKEVATRNRKRQNIKEAETKFGKVGYVHRGGIRGVLGVHGPPSASKFAYIIRVVRYARAMHARIAKAWLN